MSRKITIVVLCFLCSAIHHLVAQNIHTKQRQINVGCEHSYLGAATVVVTNYIDNSTHTPYHYVWSNGVSTSGDSVSTITNLEVGTYTVTITDVQDADYATAEFEITEDFCKMVPSAVFTPNGDGINDTWLIQKAELFPDARVIVYNRLGQKVYDHKGFYDVQWDATDIIGTPLPDAAYYYVIYQDRTDKSSVIKGCVNIVR